MKIGFVVECGPGGPEEKVFPYLVAKLRQDGSTVRITTARGKGNILRDCKDYVASLIGEGCHHVFVVWDLIPCDAEHQHDGKPCRRKEREHIEQLIAHEHRTRTTLLCITHELEAWLLADGAAITAFLKDISTHPVKPAVADHKDPESVPAPKIVMKRIFTSHRRREYEGGPHALKIVEKIKSFAKLERSTPSFKRFKERLTGL